MNDSTPDHGILHGGQSQALVWRTERICGKWQYASSSYMSVLSQLDPSQATAPLAMLSCKTLLVQPASAEPQQQILMCTYLQVQLLCA